MVPEAQARMWDLALHMEEGQTEESGARTGGRPSGRARRHGEAARRSRPTPTAQALEQRLKELQEAIDRHMQAMMEEAERNHEALPFDPEAEHLSDKDLDRLAEEARQALREGRMDEAREKMAELERQLDRLKQARADKGQGNSQQRQKGHRQMGAVQDMVGREGGLLDHTEGRNDQANRPQRIQPDPEAGDPAAQRPMDQRVQQALRQRFGRDDAAIRRPDRRGAAVVDRGRSGDAGFGSGSGRRATTRRPPPPSSARSRRCRRAPARWAARWRNSSAADARTGEPGEGEGFGAEGSMGMMMPDGRGEGSGGSAAARRRRTARIHGGGTLWAGRTRAAGWTAATCGCRRRRNANARRRSRRSCGGAARSGSGRSEELDYIDRLLRQF